MTSCGFSNRGRVRLNGERTRFLSPPPHPRGAPMSEAVDTRAAEPGAASGRTYNRWTRNSTLEDYSLRYAPRSFRKWTPYVVATTALGGIAYLADFAIGGSIAITHGFASAVTAILVAAVIIFVTGVPISYYSA